MQTAQRQGCRDSATVAAAAAAGRRRGAGAGSLIRRAAPAAAACVRDGREARTGWTRTAGARGLRLIRRRVPVGAAVGTGSRTAGMCMSARRWRSGQPTLHNLLLQPGKGKPAPHRAICVGAHMQAPQHQTGASQKQGQAQRRSLPCSSTSRCSSTSGQALRRRLPSKAPPWVQ
jgi:hypothetical protein